MIFGLVGRCRGSASAHGLLFGNGIHFDQMRRRELWSPCL